MEWPLLTNSKTIYTDWHKTFPGSGQGKQYPYLLDKILQHNKHADRNTKTPWHTLLDYGCGKGGTARWLKDLIHRYPLEIDCYDPGHPVYKDTVLREQYDCVYSADVLEHIEREDLDAVIKHTQSLSANNLHIIDLTPAKKRLPDGRNAHVTLLTVEQWQEAFDLSVEHSIQEMQTYAVADPNFGKRERLCIHTKRW